MILLVERVSLLSEFKKLINKRQKIIGKLIRSERRAKDLTQQQISDTLGVSQPSFIQKIEAGKRHLDVSELWGLCQILEIPFVEMAEKIDALLKDENSG